MNFIQAIQHATIGYGIRRKVWSERENCWLCLDDLGNLKWAPGNAVDRPAYLCPDKPDLADLAVDILPEDVAANDWETI